MSSGAYVARVNAGRKFGVVCEAAEELVEELSLVVVEYRADFLVVITGDATKLRQGLLSLMGELDD